MANSRLETISEIAVENKKSLPEVFITYFILNFRIYARNFRNKREFRWYDPHLERAAYRLTGRYFDKQRSGKIRELKRREQLGK